MGGGGGGVCPLNTNTCTSTCAATCTVSSPHMISTPSTPRTICTPTTPHTVCTFSTSSRIYIPPLHTFPLVPPPQSSSCTPLHTFPIVPPPHSHIVKEGEAREGLFAPSSNAEVSSQTLPEPDATLLHREHPNIEFTQFRNQLKGVSFEGGLVVPSEDGVQFYRMKLPQ